MTHEPASYEWACQQCGKVFMPKRITWPTGKVTTQKLCGACAMANLRMFLQDPEGTKVPRQP